MSEQSNSNFKKNVYFPILEHIRVEGYLLYPGTENNPGLNHPFLSGMNVIVGINGVGKTTLLNILFRMLAGDKDLRDGRELGDSKRNLVTVDNDIFANRVPDRAKNATATLKFRLGIHTIEIKRSLRNLELLEFKVDPPDPQMQRLEDLGDTYKAVISRLAGLDDFFDFVLILRYLTFFLEDRRTLIWDKAAQTEIFRILFFPDNVDHNYKSSLNEALSADSSARNTNAILTKEKNKLDKLIAESTKSKPEEFALLQAAYTELNEALEHQTEKTQKLDNKRRSIRQRLEQNRNDAERLHQEERALREQLLGSVFPKLDDFSAFVLSNIQSGRGCIVCGDRDQTRLAEARRKLEETLECPICCADVAHQEPHVSTEVSSSNKERLEYLAAERKKHLASEKALVVEIKQINSQFIAAEENRWKIESDLNQLKTKLKIAQAALGRNTPSNLQDFSNRIQALTETVEDYKFEKTEALLKIKTIIDALSSNVEKFKDELIEKFDVFIAAFLAERCELTHRTEPRNIGQLSSPIELLFPEFHVNMTSGVYRQSGTPRERPDTVSESQMEFIELAFRMGILSIAAREHAVTIIMETPEASLDAVFIPRAGDALNKFAKSATRQPNTLITSSNLNGSQMIPALLGLIAPPEESADVYAVELVLNPMPVDERKSRVLNLLEYAAENAALHKFPLQYQARLRDAMHLPPLASLEDLVEP